MLTKPKVGVSNERASQLSRPAWRKLRISVQDLEFVALLCKRNTETRQKRLIAPRLGLY